MDAAAHDSTPAALEWSVENCSLGRAMAILGERWTMVVLREVFLGVRRFDDVQRHAGIPRQVLTNRLALLVEVGILRKVPYRPEGGRTRSEYRLTERGFELQPILLAVTAWGDRHLADPAGPAREFVHHDCGEPLHLEIRCDRDHRVEDPRQVDGRPGPGALRASR